MPSTKVSVRQLGAAPASVRNSSSAMKAVARLIDQLPAAGQLEARSSAFAQPPAQALFQRRHVGADRRLTDVEVNLRDRKAARIDNFGKHLQQPDVAFRKIAEHVGDLL